MPCREAMHPAKGCDPDFATQPTVFSGYNIKEYDTDTREAEMYTHTVFNARKTDVREIDFLAWSVERQRDRMEMKNKTKVLQSRPRQRAGLHDGETLH